MSSEFAYVWVGAIKKETTTLKILLILVKYPLLKSLPPLETRRASPTIPGSGAESLDKQQMAEVRYEFIPGVSQPSFLQIQCAAPELLATPGHHQRCREMLQEDRVYVYEDGLRAIVGQGIKDPREVKYERKVTDSQFNDQFICAKKEEMVHGIHEGCVSM